MIKDFFKNYIKRYRITIIIFIIIVILIYIGNSSKNISNTENILLTSINVYIASLTAKYTKESSKYQRKEEDENRKNIISSQATKIYTHMIQKSLKPSHYHKNLMGPIQPVLIGNTSNQPIYKVVVISCFNKFKYSYIHKNSNICLERDPSLFIFYPILMPGIFYQKICTYGCSLGGTRPAAMIMFTDSKGYKWLRDPQGQLIKLKNYDKVCKFCHIYASDLLMTSTADFKKTYKDLEELYKDNSKEENYKIK